MVDNDCPDRVLDQRVFGVPSAESEARRQLHLSLGVVTMLAIGIVSAGVAVGGHPLAVKQDVVASRAPVTDDAGRDQGHGCETDLIVATARDIDVDRNRAAGPVFL